MNFVFYTFALLVLFSAVFTISSKNGVYSVLSLIFCLLNAAGLFVLLGAEYIAMTLVIVYVGAVAVLFLFVVMMLNVGEITYHLTLKRGVAAVLIFAVVAGFLFYIFSIAPSFPLHNTGHLEILDNTTSIGMVLYTDYIVAFQLCGIILFISMVGAIMLTVRHKRDVKRQSIYEQLQRNKNNSLELHNIQFGQGIE